MQWVEIDRAALVHNLCQFRKLIGEKRKLLAVVKANAYGHGILEVSRIAIKAGADWLGVSPLEEGLLIRREGMKCPILIVGYIPFDGLKQAVIHELRLTVYNFETIEKLARVCRLLQKRAFLHVKVETGTYRQGIGEKDLLPFLRTQKNLAGSNAYKIVPKKHGNFITCLFYSCRLFFKCKCCVF